MRYAVAIVLCLMVGCGESAEARYATAVQLYKDEQSLLAAMMVETEQHLESELQRLDVEIESTVVKHENRGIYWEYEEKERAAIEAAIESSGSSDTEAADGLQTILSVSQKVREERDSKIGDLAPKILAIENQKNLVRQQTKEKIDAQKARVERARVAMMEAEKAL